MRVWSLVGCIVIGKGGRDMNKTYDDSNWREEMKSYTSSKKDLEMLENGPKSLSQSWYMSTLYQKWKKIKGYKDPEPPDCSSSLKEWEESIKKYEDMPPEAFGPGSPLSNQAGDGRR